MPVFGRPVRWLSVTLFGLGLRFGCQVGSHESLWIQTRTKSLDVARCCWGPARVQKTHALTILNLRAMACFSLCVRRSGDDSGALAQACALSDRRGQVLDAHPHDKRGNEADGFEEVSLSPWNLCQTVLVGADNLAKHLRPQSRLANIGSQKLGDGVAPVSGQSEADPSPHKKPAVYARADTGQKVALLGASGSEPQNSLILVEIRLNWGTPDTGRKEEVGVCVFSGSPPAGFSHVRGAAKSKSGTVTAFGSEVLQNLASICSALLALLATTKLAQTKPIWLSTPNQSQYILVASFWVERWMWTWARWCIEPSVVLKETLPQHCMLYLSQTRWILVGFSTYASLPLWSPNHKRLLRPEMLFRGRRNRLYKTKLDKFMLSLKTCFLPPPREDKQGNDHPRSWEQSYFGHQRKQASDLLVDFKAKSRQVAEEESGLQTWRSKKRVHDTLGVDPHKKSQPQMDFCPWCLCA